MPPPLAPPATRGTVTISAAASTKEAVEMLAEQFQRSNQAEVRVNLGPSSGLTTQIVAGAPADLFLSASQEWADKVRAAGLAADEKQLLTGKLVLVVPRGNPAEIREPRDLLQPAVKKVALAGENVPAGKYADQALAKLSLLEPLTREGRIARGQDVRSALGYVERGEAEAGIVYSTDVAAAAVEVVHAFDPALHDEIVYVLVLLKRGDQNRAARQFFDFLQAAEANDVYQRLGFAKLP
ncbi:MAG: molybdate ABC transporter substrate-binding protein [Pirellulaceae bacterium]|nr:molybdate ABC transporter substrate-binding protein [Pirellulaceae bacterium]